MISLKQFGAVGDEKRFAQKALPVQWLPQKKKVRQFWLKQALIIPEQSIWMKFLSI